MRHSTLSFAFLLTFLATIFFLQWMTDATRTPIFWIALVIAIVFNGISLYALPPRPRRSAAFVMAGLLGLTAACATVTWSTWEPPASHISHFLNRMDVTLIGTVASEPDRRPSMTQYTVRLERMQDTDGFKRDVTGKILVRDSKGWPRYAYGDRLLLHGNLKEPWSIDGFDYGKYLALQGIAAILTSATIEKAGTGDANLFPFALGRSGPWIGFGALYALKEHFEAQIERLLPEPHASFLAGLLTGARRSIPKEILNDFNATSTSHILAISGYNITIILTLIGGMLFWLPFRWRFIPSVALVAAFTLFTGASASVVRAAVMGSLGLFALQLGRQQNVRLSLLWTAFFMLLWKPQYLWNDASFQLSFLAVVGLSEAAALINPFTTFLPQTLGIRDATRATLSAQLFTLPWIILLFGRLSLIAPVANLLIAPLIPLAMLFGFVSVCISVLSFPIGILLSYATWGILSLILLIAHFLAHLPYASVEVKIGRSMTAVLYVCIGLLIVFVQRVSIPAGRRPALAT